MIKKMEGANESKQTGIVKKKWKKITNKEVIQTRRSLRSLHQLRQDPAGWYANAHIATCQETKIQLKHVSLLSPVESSHSLLFISSSVVAPSHIFRVQRRKHSRGAPGSKTRSSVSTSAHSKGVANRRGRAEHHRGMEGTQNSIWPGAIVLIAAVCEWRPSARDTKSSLCCWTGLHLLISLREQKNTSVLHRQASAKMLLACYKIESSWKECYYCKLCIVAQCLL